MDNTREKLIEFLRNGIWAAMDEDNRYLYTDVVDYMMAYGVTLDNQVSSSKWIPVTERLPENIEDVLLCRKGWNEIRNLQMGWYNDVSGGWFDLSNREIYNVTHWMPLPEPPKEG